MNIEKYINIYLQIIKTLSLGLHLLWFWFTFSWLISRWIATLWFRFSLKIHLLRLLLFLWLSRFRNWFTHCLLNIFIDLFYFVSNFGYISNRLFPFWFWILFFLDVFNPWSTSINEIKRLLSLLNGYMFIFFILNKWNKLRVSSIIGN